MLNLFNENALIFTKEIINRSARKNLTGLRLTYWKFLDCIKAIPPIPFAYMTSNNVYLRIGAQETQLPEICCECSPRCRNVIYLISSLAAATLAILLAYGCIPCGQVIDPMFWAGMCATSALYIFMHMIMGVLVSEGCIVIRSESG